MTGAGYYHGGRPGLSVGDKILPPTRTGVTTAGDIVREYGPSDWYYNGVRHRRDRVYMGSWAPAFVYASLWTLTPFQPGDGAMYEVVPGGQGRPDPGMPARTGCVEAEYAVITRIASPAVTRATVMWVDPDLRKFEWFVREVDRARARGRRLTGAELERGWCAGYRDQAEADRELQVATGIGPGAAGFVPYLRALGL